jgi:hypothetical protein
MDNERKKSALDFRRAHFNGLYTAALLQVEAITPGSELFVVVSGLPLY